MVCDISQAIYLGQHKPAKEKRADIMTRFVPWGLGWGYIAPCSIFNEDTEAEYSEREETSPTE